MGGLVSVLGGSRMTKITPTGDVTMHPSADHASFVPPILHLNPKNKWLPLLTPSQLVEIHTAFKRFDRDGDGHIEPKEIKTVMGNIGVHVSDEKASAIIASVDTDGNGMIEFDEFVSIMASNMLKTDGAAELERAFDIFQQDSPGFVDVGLFRQYLTTLGSRPMEAAELDTVLGSLRPDENGRVPLDEFRRLACWQVPEYEAPGGAAGLPVASRSGGISSSETAPDAR